MHSAASLRELAPYVGADLDLFQSATNWKSVVRAKLKPYLGRSVLEVGAGIGGTTRVLCTGREDRWLCLEPDARLAEQLRRQMTAALPGCCELLAGTLDALPQQARFDTVLYVDVLEHIQDDAGELQRAARLLVPGGHLIVVAPAHQWLFAPFDAAIGHYRRYSRPSLAAVGPADLKLVQLIYLDSVGLLASLCNRYLLRRTMPTRRQVAVWDRGMIPLSRIADRCLRGSVGRSVLAVWEQC